MIARPAGDPGNLGSLLCAGPDPDRVALVEVTPGAVPRTVDFGTLNAWADAVARGLLRRGLERGQRVGLVAANSADFVASYLGILRAGLVAVPVNWRQPAAGIADILADADVALVLCDAPRRPLCPAGLPTLDFEQGLPALLDHGSFAAVQPAADDAALFLYTSGSGGRPKGVMLSHHGYRWGTRVRTQEVDLARHRFLVAAPLYHMNALNTAQLALTGRGTLVLMPQFDAAAYLDALQSQRCTWITAIPTMISLLALETERLRHADLSFVERVRLGSEPVGARVLESARTLFPRAAISNGYGTTETGAVIFGPHPGGLPTPALSLGCAQPSVQIRLVAADDAAAPEGVLQVRSPALMLGYHRRPTESAAAFTADGYYATGDVIRRDAEGFHYFVGRADDMFVCGGENVFPSETERLLERHPQVMQACVIGVPDTLKGFKPVAYVVPRTDARPTEQALKAHVLALAPPHLHPRRIVFVDSLPLTGSGKVDRKTVAGWANASNLDPAQATDYPPKGASPGAIAGVP
ncbi:MAG: acyl--CoA ligase [Proteobacteria bacterium]|nr:acyl--CoA ligase [Pseudomonadota bacterium]